MIYPLVRPVLFRMDPERAHGVGLGAARFLSHHPGLCRFVHDWLSRPASHAIQLAGLTFPNRIGLAAGLDKNAEAPMAWWAFGFGFVELGTVTPVGQPGKPRPRLFRFPREQALVNRMGFNNDGAEAVAARLKAQAAAGQRPPIPIGLSIGKNAITPAEKAADDYAKAAEVLGPHADYLAINISSPNTPGLRDLQAAGEVATLLRAVRVASPKPVFVKIAPELESESLVGVVEACAQEGAVGIIATNTRATLGQNGLPEGGQSGRPIRELSLRQVARVRQIIGSRMAIVGCGGIDDAPSARAMFDAGADLIQIYTGLIYRGPFLPARLSRALG